MTDKTNLGYLCFRKNEEGARPKLLDFQLIDSLDQFEAWKAGEPISKKQEQEVETKSANTDQNGQTAFSDSSIKLIERMKSALMAYHPLIALNEILPRLAQVILADQRMLQLAKETLPLIKEEGNISVYAVPMERAHEFISTFSGLREIAEGYAVIPGSVMLSLVATFDSLMSDLLRTLLLADPKRFATSQKTIEVKEILSMSSFDQVIEKVIEDEIDNVMRGSHADQVKYVEKNFKIGIQEGYERWPQFIEIFERRNLVAHGSSTVNRIYLENCRTAGVDVSALNVGDTLDLDAKYLHRAVNVLAEFAILSVVTITLKRVPKQREQIYKRLNAIAFDLIREKRTRLASWILDFALNKQKASVPDSLLKMMTVNLANALKKAGEAGRASEVIDGTDWTATADAFQICVASLREDIPEVLRLMPRVHAANSVTVGDFHDWPVFDWIRSNADVRAEFEALYGEPLFDRQAIAEAIIHKDEVEESAKE